jgi:signal transduction histidine kinase
MAWTTAARLALLLVLLVLVASFYLGDRFGVQSVSIQLALATLVVSFALAGAYAALLRRGRNLTLVADVQLVLDQMTWTVFVYLSGGASSGATSFYGLSCVVGAILTGMRGAALAALTGAGCYTFLALSLHFGLIEAPADQPRLVYELSGAELKYYVLVNLLVIIVVTMLSGYLAERLRIAGGQLVEARERAEQAERMAALGRLAAGLAHEIRNPLSSIAGSIQLLKTNPALEDEGRELCAIIQREASRLNELVTDMLDLARPREPSLMGLEIVEVVREVVLLAGSSGRGRDDVAVEYSGLERTVVQADGAQFRQLVWNLVRNGIQASHSGGVVAVQLVADGEAHVCLRVSDEGEGIEDSAREHIFDAFFTTRSKGTGVGLAVVKRIADQHGFEVDVGGAPGAGATFTVRMPAESLDGREDEAS